MNGDTGKTMPVFGMFDNGGDLVETSFLMQGLLAARQYFNGDSAAEHDLYSRITKLWEMRRVGLVPRRPDRVTSSTGTGRRMGDGRFIIR